MVLFPDHSLWLIFAVALALTLLFHFLNRKPRADVDAAVAPLKVPVRRYAGYSARALADFRTHAVAASPPRGQCALDLYRRWILPIDMGFALSLAVSSLYLWQNVIVSTGLTWISLMGWAMSGLYEAMDLGEDASLFLLLSKLPPAHWAR